MQQHQRSPQAGVSVGRGRPRTPWCRSQRWLLAVLARLRLLSPLPTGAPAPFIRPSLQSGNPQNPHGLQHAWTLLAR